MTRPSSEHQELQIQAQRIIGAIEDMTSKHLFKIKVFVEDSGNEEESGYVSDCDSGGIDIRIESPSEGPAPMTIHLESDQMLYLSLGDQCNVEFFTRDNTKDLKNTEGVVSLIRDVMTFGMVERFTVGPVTVRVECHLGSEDGEVLARSRSIRSRSDRQSWVKEYAPYPTL